MTGVFEIPVLYKTGLIAGSAAGLVVAQVVDLLPLDMPSLVSQSVFVTAVVWASRLIVRTVRQAQTEVVSAKDQQIATLEARVEFLSKQLALRQAEQADTKKTDTKEKQDDEE